MRLLLVIPYAPSLERPRSFNFIKRLSRRHEVSLVTLVTSAEEDERVRKMSAYCEVVKPIHIEKWQFYGNCLRYLPTAIPLRAASCFSAQADQAIAQLLRRERYDIVQVEQIRAAHFGARLQDVVKVYDSTDSITLLLQRAYQNASNPFKKALFLEELIKMRRYEPRISARFDRILMCSEEDERALRQLNPNLKISIIRNGVDLDYFRPQAVNREPGRIVFSGRLGYYVNADAVHYFLTRVFPLILKKKPDATLDIVGSNPPRQLLDQASGHVRVTGFVPDIRPYLARASAAVCPVRLAVGTQNKIIEAMAMGTPVVSTTQGCTGLAVEDTRELLVAADPFEFAEKVVEVLNDGQMAQQLSKYGRSYVGTHHNWDSIVRDLEDVYDQVTHGQW